MVLTTQVLDLADSDPGISLNHAGLYLTHVRRAADTLEVHATDLALTTGTARAVLRLVIGGRIRPEDTAALIQLTVSDPAASVETLAQAGGLLAEHSTPLLEQAIHQALTTLGLTVDNVRRMTAKDRRRTRDRLLGTVRTQQPTATLVEVILGPWHR